MCRFSTARAVPRPVVATQDALGGNFTDDLAMFNWFDAIDDVPANGGVETANAASSDSQDSSAPAIVKSEELSSHTYPGDMNIPAEMDLLEFFKDELLKEGRLTNPTVDAANVSQTANAFNLGTAAVSFSAPGNQRIAPAPLSEQLPAAMPEQQQQLLAGASSGVPIGLPNAAVFPNFPYSSWMGMAGYSGSKGVKTQQEMDDAVERIKRKRRESAQRSRARKNAYMKQLEMENKGLKEQIMHLQEALTSLQEVVVHGPGGMIHAAGQV